MSRLVTRGVRVIDDNDNYVTDFIVRDKETGQEIYLERQNNGKYSTAINGIAYLNETKKQLKQYFTERLERGCDELAVEVGSRDEGLGSGAEQGLWESCNPNALIIELVAALGSNLDGPDGQKLLGLIRVTLDNYGYLNEDGSFDAVQSRREIDHWLAKGTFARE